MFQIDDAFLTSLGLGSLPQEEKERMKAHIYETLEMRVGMTLASNMTDAQLDEFEDLMNKNDEEGALHWLETNFPNYKQVVADELEKLKAEVRSAAPQIVAASTGQPSMPQQMDQPQPQQPMHGQSDQPQNPPQNQPPAQPNM